MDWLDAAAACRAAQPWDTLACFEELHIEVGWSNTSGCDVVQFPVARLLAGGGLLGFATASDAASFNKGGLGAVTDVVMKISWEPRRGGGPSETRPRVAVIAPGVADDGAFGTLACPPTPSEEMWATLALHVLPVLAQEARYGGVGAPDEAADIWATVGNIQARAEADVRVQDIPHTIKGTIGISGIPKGASPARAGEARSGGRSTNAGGAALPFSARTALSTGRTFDSATTSTSVNRIVPRMRERLCRHCGSAVSVPNSPCAAQADHSQGIGPITCRCNCAFYCTARCQALDWSAGHDVECAGFAAAHAAVRDMASLPFFPYVDDVTRLISAGATCICEVLTCWGLHEGVSAWRYLPGCACFPDEPSPDISGAVTHLRPLNEALHSRSSRALTLFSSCRGWNELYAMVKLPSAAPDAMVYTHAATLYHVLRLLAARNQVSVQAARGDGATSEDILVLDCLQPPAALIAFPSQLLLLQRLLGSLSVHVRLVGSSVPAKCSGTVLAWGPNGTVAPRTGPSAATPGSTKPAPRSLTRVPARVLPGTLLVSYHHTQDLADFLTSSAEADGGGTLSDALVALDAALARDPIWEPLLANAALLVNEGLPLFVTERNLYAASHAIAKLTAAECLKPFALTLNPFRGPFVCPSNTEDDRVDIPSMPNAFLLGFGVDALEEEPVVDEDEDADGSDSDVLAEEVDDELPDTDVEDSSDLEGSVGDEPVLPPDENP